ncbi:hypothetical protein SEMRO_2567_G331470.1 [Seminavis robusta]|uniref:Uncharacterized protein n=1 Tax=Seminavis robusta TaxID=568900 RepID=A0A9N8F2T4_9STRA|nr:hypothetical protein SEMRO_2567_G331470.1 [Seminavis robusta]|eukprot:Sro2567_g331470.1 n/a (846) ;mRNA; f:1449-3986
MLEGEEQDARDKLEQVDTELALQVVADSINDGEVVNLDEPVETLVVGTLATPSQPAKPPVFSAIDDPEGWNAQVPSKTIIDRIVSTNFQNRKSLQMAKMQNIRARALKIDFNYKMVKCVKVYTGHGECFSPFQCSVNVHQENGLCVYFKAYHITEGFGPNCMGPDLEKLKEHFDYLGCNIGIVWVDNCCNVRKKLQETFGEDCLVKLDSWHWHERWEGIIHDKKSAEAQVFYYLMRRATYVTEDSELERAKEAYQRRTGREPTKKQLMKEAKSTIPPKDILKSRVEEVLRYVHHNDSLVDLEESNLARVSDPADGEQVVTRRRFFSTNRALVARTIKNQMKHVEHGCLSDPPKEVMEIHQVNPYTEQAFSSRSTGTNEADNRLLNRLFKEATTVGIARAERITFDHYEKTNDNRAVKRLGAPMPITSHSERVYFMNSVAKSAGFNPKDLPLQVSYPPSVPVIEYMGYDYELPDCLKEVTTRAEDDVPDGGAEGRNDFQDFLAGVDFADDDVPVQTPEAAAAEERILQDPEIDTEPHSLTAAAFEQELAKHLPHIRPKETSMQTFTRLTNGSPWVDFGDPREQGSPSDKAEFDLFESLSPNYDRHSNNMNGPRGYYRFSKRWDIEVAKNTKERTDAIWSGMEPPPMIRRESALQLQQHHDRVLACQQQANLAGEDPARQQLEEAFRVTQRQMGQHQTSVMAGEALRFDHDRGNAPLGNPLALNNNITAASVGGRVADPTAPFVIRQVRKATIVENPMLNPRGTNFRNRKYCVVCGFSKSDHSHLSRQFGNDCSGNCGREECSKCFQRLEFHELGKVGPYCEYAPSSGSGYSDWYINTESNNENRRN